MKYLLALIFVFSFVTVHSVDAPALESKASSWRIIRKGSTCSCSANFHCKMGETPQGTVVRSGLFSPRYYYDYFDAQNNFQIRGITRAFSWGFLFAWGMEIDLYDAQSEALLGMIEGKFFTYARAKFVFYDAQQTVKAIAYLNTDSADFVIVSPTDEAVILAELSGKVYGDIKISELNVFHAPLVIDDRVLKIFTAFILDYQTSFAPPPQVVHNYQQG